MSANALCHAWTVDDVYPHERLLLLAIADNVGSDQYATVTEAYLEDSALLPPPSLAIALRRLEDAGVIVVTPHGTGPRGAIYDIEMVGLEGDER
jgi:DNA-binding PadR family transcriptional regulator